MVKDSMQTDEKMKQEDLKQEDMEYIVSEFKGVIDVYRMEYPEDLITLFNEFGYLLIYYMAYERFGGNDRQFTDEEIQDWSSGMIKQFLWELENGSDAVDCFKQPESINAIKEWHLESGIHQISVIRQILLIIKELIVLKNQYRGSNIMYGIARRFLDLCVNTKGEQSASYVLPDELVGQLLGLVCIGRDKPVRILDSQCGSGSMLIAAGKYLEGASCEGFEGDRKLWVSSQILSILSETEIRVENRAFLEKAAEMEQRYDLVLANPPFNNVSVSWEQASEWNETIRGKHNLMLKQSLCALQDDGSAILVVPDSFLFSTRRETVELRRWILQRYRLDAVISLPAKTFSPNARVKSSVLILKNEIRKDILDCEINPYVLFYELRTEAGEPGQKEEYGELKKIFSRRKDYYGQWLDALRDHSVENVHNIVVPGKWEYADFWFADMESIESANCALLAKSYQPAEEYQLEYEAPDILLQELIRTQEEILEEMKALLAEVQDL